MLSILTENESGYRFDWGSSQANGFAIFVNLSKTPIALEKKFSGYYPDRVKGLSTHFEDFRKITLTRRFNWKSIQENLRDGLHPAFLQKNTLLNSIAFEPPAIPKDVPLPLLWFRDTGFGSPDVALSLTFDQKQFFPDAWFWEKGYYNYHLFPGLHIAAADGGYTFVLENYLPVVQRRLKLRFISFLPTIPLILSKKMSNLAN